MELSRRTALSPNNNKTPQHLRSSIATGIATSAMVLTVDQKRLKAMKFPPEFNEKVDTKQVNMDLMKKWIAGKITGILGDEDDVVVETCYNLLEVNRHVSS